MRCISVVSINAPNTVPIMIAANGKISSDDYRLWEAAGLGDAGWADIPGDM